MTMAVLSEPFRSRAYARDNDAQSDDDSLENFLALRLGPELARTLGSALVHGIYAADSRQLSVRAAFPSLWEAARKGKGSIVRGMLARSSGAPSLIGSAYELGSVEDLMQDVSVYSFHDGMTTLVEALTSALEQNSNVNLVKGDAAIALINDNKEGSTKVSIITTQFGYIILSD